MRYMNLLSALTLTLQYSTLGYRARSKSSNLGAVTTDRPTSMRSRMHLSRAMNSVPERAFSDRL